MPFSNQYPTLKRVPTHNHLRSSNDRLVHIQTTESPYYPTFFHSMAVSGNEAHYLLACHSISPAMEPINVPVYHGRSFMTYQKSPSSSGAPFPPNRETEIHARTMAHVHWQILCPGRAQTFLNPLFPAISGSMKIYSI